MIDTFVGRTLATIRLVGALGAVYEKTNHPKIITNGDIA